MEFLNNPRDPERQSFNEAIFAPLDATDTNISGESFAKRAEVTKESQEFSNHVLLAVSEEVESILAEQGFQLYDPYGCQLGIRENGELRKTLGNYIHYTLRGSSEAPIHKQGHAEPTFLKSPSFPGYDRMPPVDYATLLAIAMLDGTFKRESPAYDMPCRYDNGNFAGVHRESALIGLGLDRKARDGLLGTKRIAE